MTCRKNIFAGLLFLFVFVLGSGCTLNSRAVRIEKSDSISVRNQLAGKTLECAGSARRDAIIAGVAGSVAGGAGSLAGGLAPLFAQSTTPLGYGIYYGLGASSCLLGAASVGCAIYAFISQYSATELDQRAGKIFANQSDMACVEGALPEPPPEAPSSTSALNLH
jgi:hypothetical protein